MAKRDIFGELVEGVAAMKSDRPPIQAPYVKTRGTRTVQQKDAP